MNLHFYVKSKAHAKIFPILGMQLNFFHEFTYNFHGNKNHEIFSANTHRYTKESVYIQNSRLIHLRP